MIFLVGVEGGLVLVEAEGLTHQPVAAAGVGLALDAIGLVAQAHESLPVGQLGLEAVLLGLAGRDVKEGDPHVVDLDRLAVADLAQDDRLADGLENLLGDHELAHGVEGVAHGIVAVDGERAAVLALENHGRDLAHHPDGSQDVVGVAMGDKHVADALKGDLGRHELGEDAVAAAAVHQHAAPWRAQVEARVVAVDTHGVACSQHGDRGAVVVACGGRVHAHDSDLTLGSSMPNVVPLPTSDSLM